MRSYALWRNTYVFKCTTGYLFGKWFALFALQSSPWPLEVGSLLVWADETFCCSVIVFFFYFVSIICHASVAITVDDTSSYLLLAFPFPSVSTLKLRCELTVRWSTSSRKYFHSFSSQVYPASHRHHVSLVFCYVFVWRHLFDWLTSSFPVQGWLCVVLSCLLSNQSRILLRGRRAFSGLQTPDISFIFH